MPKLLRKTTNTALVLLLLSLAFSLSAQKNKKAEPKKDKDELSLSALKFRSVGPSLTSGRISDFAMNPDNPFEYYVAVSSGGVWKTINNGTTYTPIFDGQASYSIGCVTIDPNNHNTVWVGSGENNNQRSVAYGDGVYKSINGGKSWKNMGLKTSEHIGKIIVHPTNSDIVYVAAIGPLWSSGGDRGVYKTTDGGETWKAVLTIDKHTGVTDIVMDPRNPDILFAAAYQRRRHVFTYLGGGPSSGMYKTSDGGENWEKANSGLPTVDLGRIGLDISPANPDIIYAIVEAAEGKGGFYKSTNGAVSWSKAGSYSTSGNYYQEIIADPVDANTVYAMDTWMKVSKDGGATFKNVGEDFKHVDNHCMWINPHNNKHFLVGCDGGIYETWDEGKTWDFKANLPVTQFYKVALDNDYPFYNIYGGTQDNFSLGGPSRTITQHGIMNQEWFITHGGDGFESQVDPENPNIVYAQSQYGFLVRYDKMSGEEVGIKPAPRKGENAYRWNWDAPLQVSNHVSGRLYFSANKVFRSDDYGNSWDVISEDLTQQINRNELKVMDKVWGIGALAKNRSTSPYGTIVAFSESPLNKDLLVVGTDDGLIHITENGGETWTKKSNISGVPNRSYINAVQTSHHDENVLFAVFNHHKYGDFKPYVFKSINKGLSWTSISSNLPKRGSVYCIEQDHVDPNLLFAGTEFGVFFSRDGGKDWKQLKSGVPTIAVRDIAIQKRENDLVLGTFGRGFYVLDDYSILRNIPADGKMTAPQIFAVRDALMYEQSVPLGLPKKSFQGDSFYSGDNLDPVAIIRYYFNEDIKSAKDKRKDAEKELRKKNMDVAYPSYEELKKEGDENDPQLMFTIKDSQGAVVKRLFQKPKKGLQTIHWDLRYNSQDQISLSKPSFYNPFAGQEQGPLVAPGQYSVSMTSFAEGVFTDVGEAVTFNVKALNNTVMPAKDREAKVAFQRQVSDLSRSIQGARGAISDMTDKLRYIREAVKKAESPSTDIMEDMYAFRQDLRDVITKVNGDRVKGALDMDQPPTPQDRLGMIEYEQGNSTAPVTQSHKVGYQIAKEEFRPILQDIERLQAQLKKIEEKLEKVNAPYTPGRKVRINWN